MTPTRPRLLSAITVVGLGPGDPMHLTVAARAVLEAAQDIWVRTASHPSVKAIPAGKTIKSCDDLYEEHDTFEAVYAAIAARIVDEATRARADQPVVYAVPGDPTVGETSVEAIRRLAADAGIPVAVLPAVSFIEPTLAVLGWDALDGLQLADATTLGERHYPSIDAGVPALIAQVYSQLVASDLKLTLLAQYPPEHPVILISGASTDHLVTRILPLAEVDHYPDDLGDLTSLAVPALARPGSLLAFADVVARLRAPDGCPWDIEQTHLTLRPFVLEETYEVLEALDAEDTHALCEELGDLLLQIVLHSQIAVEEGEFSLADVIAGITEKIIRRHPHVFGDVKAETADDVRANWEMLKRQERANKARGQSSPDAAASDLAPGPPSGAGAPSGVTGNEVTQNAENGADNDLRDDPFAGIPVALPALARAQAVQRRAARIQRAGLGGAGEAVDAAPDVGAALRALANVMEDGNGSFDPQPVDPQQSPDAKIASRRIGEALWAVVALARAWDVDAETVLREMAARAVETGRAAQTPQGPGE